MDLIENLEATLHSRLIKWWQYGDERKYYERLAEPSMQLTRSEIRRSLGITY